MIDTKSMPFLADIPRYQSKLRGKQTAIWFEGNEITYSALDYRSNQVANGLITLGVLPNDRIAYLGKNTDLYWEILFGANKCRATMAAVNNRLAAPELKFILSDSDAVTLFVSKEYFEAVQSIVADCPKLKNIFILDGQHDDWLSYEIWRERCSKDDPCLMHKGNDDVLQLYTSGTTGLPKGVQLTNDNFLSFFEQARELDWAAYEVGDPVLDAMPFFHIAGVNIGLLSLIQGSKAVILREINPYHILDLIEQQKIRHGFLVPAVILMLVQIQPIEFLSYHLARPRLQNLVVGMFV